MRPPPTTDRPTAPPSSSTLRGEWRTVLQPARLVVHSRRLLEQPRGDGRLTVLVPGYLAPEASMAPMRWYLRSRRHDAKHWGLGTNRGDPESLRFTFLERLERMVEHAGRPANLVAWSLGGVVIREVARLRPDLVNRLVCYGSPLIGGPKYTIGAESVGPDECDRIEAVQEQLERDQPLQVPLTTIFSRADGVVDWRASLDHHSAQVDHVEVRSSHVGLGIDPDVWAAVADALAAPH